MVINVSFEESSLPLKQHNYLTPSLTDIKQIFLSSFESIYTSCAVMKTCKLSNRMEDHVTDERYAKTNHPNDKLALIKLKIQFN